MWYQLCLFSTKTLLIPASESSATENFYPLCFQLCAQRISLFVFLNFCRSLDVSETLFECRLKHKASKEGHTVEKAEVQWSSKKVSWYHVKWEISLRILCGLHFTSIKKKKKKPGSWDCFLHKSHISFSCCAFNHWLKSVLWNWKRASDSVRFLISFILLLIVLIYD